MNNIPAGLLKLGGSEQAARVHAGSARGGCSQERGRACQIEAAMLQLKALLGGQALSRGAI